VDLASRRRNTCNTHHPKAGLIALLTVLPRVRLKVSKLIIACRNVEKGEAAMARIYQETGVKERNILEVWQVDLDSYQSVLAFTERVRTQLPRLDGFIANAGVELKSFELSEGLERSLTINVVSTMLMVIGVLPKLKETASTGSQANMTIIGSMVHLGAPDEQLRIPENRDMFEALSDPDTADMESRYSLSKLVLHQCFNGLADSVTPSKKSKNQVVVNLVHPGWCSTDLFRSRQVPLPERIMFALTGRTAEQGGRSLVYGVVQGNETNGRYISECQVKPQSSYVRSAEGLETRKRLWGDLVKRITNISPETAAFVH
jgi:retinol dehydrogenase-12